MTASNLILWEKIKAFSLDDQVSFPFSERVARENGWSRRYTSRVIDEYKKFIFMCCLSEQGVTPSDPVDQVWHLHLTYTRSYWTDFCKNTLEKEIHHNPTKGGEYEAAKFDGYYSHTRQFYIEQFESEPPADIWQSNSIRFSDIHFQRVNLKQYWLIKKPGKTLKNQWFLFGFILTGIASIQASGVLLGLIIFAGVVAIIYNLQIRNDKNRNNHNDDGGGGGALSGCSSGSNDGHNSHHGDSGSSSGCSGCSSSGCGGCGGGD